MIHSRYRRLLLLHAYGELTPRAERSLRQHLESCQECRTEQEKMKALHALLDTERSREPDEELLTGMRQVLDSSLRGARAERSAHDSLWTVLSPRLAPRLTYALGLIAAFAAGSFLGYQFFGPEQPEPSSVASWGPDRILRESVAGHLQIAGVRFVDSGDDPVQVIFTIETAAQARLKGSVDDPEVQKLLAHALASERNPGMRIRTVNAIAPHAGMESDREVKAALILALKNDENVGVRTSALEALTHYPYDQEIRDALLLALLYDENPGIRISAINNLDTLSQRNMVGDHAVLDAFRKTLQNDTNDYIRMKVHSVIEEARQQ